MTIPESFIVGSAVALVAAIIGWFLNRNSAKKAVKMSFDKLRDLINIQEFNKAESIFRSAFTKEIRLLKKGKPNDNWLENTAYLIIENAFIKHENAKILFEPFLDGIDRIRFNQLWEEYRSKETKEEIPDDDFFCYNSNPGDFETEKSKRKLALNRIKQLLEFTHI